MRNVLYQITQFCCRRPGGIGVLALLVLGFSVWTMATKLAVVTDTDAMIDPALDYRQAYSAFQKSYPQLGDTVAVVIDGDAPELRQRVAAALAARLAEDQSNFKAIYAPSVLPFFQENGLLLLSYDALAERMDALVAAQPFLGPLLREPSLVGLLDSLAEAKREAVFQADIDRVDGLLADLADVMRAALEDRPGVLSFQNALLKDDARPFDVVVVQPILDPTKLQPAKAALAALKAHIARVERQGGGVVSVSLTGKIALNAEELKTVSSGAANAGILSAILVSIVLFFGVRCFRCVAAMLINLLLGLAVTGAAALWLFGSLNIISVAFAVLFIGLGIDFSIHILLRARESGSSVDFADALSDASRTSGAALAICAPTTALAFLSFTPTGYAGLAQLGAIAAIGVFVAMVSALTVLPALLIILRVKPQSGGTPSTSRGFVSPGVILTITAVVFIPSVFIASGIGFSADPISLKDASAPSVVTYKRLAAREDSSPYAMQVLRRDLAGARDSVEAAKAMPSIGRVVWLESFLPQEQGDKLELIGETNFLLAADLAVTTAPGQVDVLESRRSLAALASETDREDIAVFSQAAAQNVPLLTDLQSRTLETLPDLRQTLKTQLSTRGVSRADIPEAITERYVGEDGSFRIELFPDQPITDEAGLEAFVESVRSVFPSATGSPVQIVESGRIVQRAMLQATGTAFLLVTVFLTFALRSMRQVILVLIPVCLAGVFTMATAAMLGLSFNFANVIVLPLLLGLGVDAGIHYVKRAFEVGGNAHSLDTGTTGKAVLLSALTTVGSFGTLMVSGHDGTASMGQLLTIALCWLLVTTLVVLPALLAVMSSVKKTPQEDV